MQIVVLLEKVCGNRSVLIELCPFLKLCDQFGCSEQVSLKIH